MARYYLKFDRAGFRSVVAALNAEDTGAMNRLRYAYSDTGLSIEIARFLDHAKQRAFAGFVWRDNVADGEMVGKIVVPDPPDDPRRYGIAGMFGARVTLPTDYVYLDFRMYVFSDGYSAIVERGRFNRILICRGNKLLGASAWNAHPAMLRFRFNGTALKVRAWQVGQPEPGPWTLEVTDATYATGAAGVAASLHDYHGRAETQTVIFGNLGLDAGGTNAPTAGNLKTLSGQVTMGGTPVNGAKVIAVRHGVDLTKPLIPGIDIAEATTDANGNYTINLDTDAGPWHLAVQNEDVCRKVGILKGQGGEDH